MTSKSLLQIEELNRQDVVAILARNRVGRIAYSMRDRVDIEPIHYVYSDGWLYGRTSPGTKLTTVQRNRWVAFEVDEVSSFTDWRSVVVHGALYVLEPDDVSPTAEETWERAVELLRRLDPAALTTEDPVPHRDVVFRIAVQEATGRRATAGM
ncbi:MAG TPA: pyridoxamine 5'-phosphate oxidase family protein [Gemmatimonadaceae bacterium]|nr:pyridoxamine 5'-phosphate oxidase family protein [Gemmatimonadaceae bacterium]